MWQTSAKHMNFNFFGPFEHQHMTIILIVRSDLCPTSLWCHWRYTSIRIWQNDVTSHYFCTCSMMNIPKLEHQWEKIYGCWMAIEWQAVLLTSQTTLSLSSSPSSFFPKPMHCNLIPEALLWHSVLECSLEQVKWTLMSSWCTSPGDMQTGRCMCLSWLSVSWWFSIPL